jgi:anhydro-N-acetylmuramic acid kinase
MKVVGLMSGTSADGVDVALCEIDGSPETGLHARVIKAGSIAYDSNFRQRILLACDGGRVDEICRLNVAIAEKFVEAIRQVLGDISDVDLIGSHGQTVWHDITVDGSVTSTLQIGTGAILAEQTGITTVNNFRERDVASGGQGAPLTAYVDWLLLRHPTHWRAVQNIGGMGNVTFLPPLNNTTSNMIAFDTGPGNVLIDGVVTLLTNGTQTYDADGDMAERGHIDEAWLKVLMAHPYYQQAPPRTTGRELFNQAMIQRLVAEGRQRQLSDNDIVATITALTVESIAQAYELFTPSKPEEVIIGGGGGHNKTLMNALERRLAPASVIRHETLGYSSDDKEALVFAVLAYETWHNRHGCLPAQTGARHGSVLGQITPADNYVSLLRRTFSLG